MRLRALFTGEVTHRELINYIRHLPRDSALGQVLLGPAAGWDEGMHRLTDVAELLTHGNYIAARAAGGKAKKPKPFKRPEVPDDID